MHLGSDGHTVQTRQLLAEQAAFQARMDGNHLGLLAEHFGVDADHLFPQCRIRLVLPGRVLTHLGITGIIESGQITQLLQQLLFLRIDTAAHREGQTHAIAQLGNTKVQTGLNQAGNVVAHFLDTIGAGAQQTNDLGGQLRGQRIAAQGIHIKGLDRCFGLIVLLPDFRLELLGNAVDPFQTDTHGHQVSLAAAGDGIILGTAGKRSQTQGHQRLDSAHEFAHDLVGIGPVLVDLHTGMAALQPVHHQPDAGAVDAPPFLRQIDGCPGAAGAGNGEDAFILRVQIDEGSALQHGKINSGSTQHTHLFVGGDDHFQRRMGNGGVVQQCQRISNGNAVVTAQGSTLGEDTAAVMGHIQTLHSHINGAGCILFADHIHMTLEDHGRMVPIAAGTFLENDDVIHFILNIS